jgi:phage portal protein BeeE
MFMPLLTLATLPTLAVSIEVPGELTEEQASDIGRDWNITHTGPYRAGKIGILSGGATFKPLTINAQDAQLLDTRRFSVEEIARIYRMPLALVGPSSSRCNVICIS